MRGARLVPLMLAAAALTLASCGSSSNDVATLQTTAAGHVTTTVATKTPAPTTTRADYIRRADLLCAAADRRQQPLHARAVGLALNKLPPVLQQQAAVAYGLSRQLKQLPMPSGDSVPVGRFTAAVNKLGVYSTALANSVTAGHTFAARSLGSLLIQARQTEALLAQGYGYKVCGDGKSY